MDLSPICLSAGAARGSQPNIRGRPQEHAPCLQWQSPVPPRGPAGESWGPVGAALGKGGMECGPGCRWEAPLVPPLTLCQAQAPNTFLEPTLAAALARSVPHQPGQEQEEQQDKGCSQGHGRHQVRVFRVITRDISGDVGDTGQLGARDLLPWGPWAAHLWEGGGKGQDLLGEGPTCPPSAVPLVCSLRKA